MLIAAFCFCLVLLLILLFARSLYLRRYKCGKNVCVLVLGDIGRSPRMQYHAISFARQGYTVDLVGYPGSLPVKEICENACIRVHHLRPPPELQNSMNYSHSSMNQLRRISLSDVSYILRTYQHPDRANRICSTTFPWSHSLTAYHIFTLFTISLLCSTCFTTVL